MRKEQAAIREAIRKERLEIRKQNNTRGLYNQYEKDSGNRWKRGMDENPGARRENEHSRSRSRSRDRENKKERRGNDEPNDNSSNYSFILGKDLDKLNNAMN